MHAAKIKIRDNCSRCGVCTGVCSLLVVNFPRFMFMFSVLRENCVKNRIFV